MKVTGAYDKQRPPPIAWVSAAIHKDTPQFVAVLKSIMATVAVVSRPRLQPQSKAEDSQQECSAASAGIQGFCKPSRKRKVAPVYNVLMKREWRVVVDQELAGFVSAGWSVVLPVGTSLQDQLPPYIRADLFYTLGGERDLFGVSWQAHYCI